MWTVLGADGCYQTNESDATFDAAGSNTSADSGSPDVFEGDACDEQMGDANADSDDGGQRERNSSAMSSPVDAGPAPPDYCVAPCVWEAVRRCIPDLQQCVTTDDSATMSSVVCDPFTGWFKASLHSQPKTSEFVVGRDGVICISFSTSAALAFPTFFVADSDGKMIAFGDSEGTVFCGDLASANYAGAQPIDGGVELEDGRFFPSYHLETEREECAAWNSRGFPVVDPCPVVDADAGACGFKMN